MSYQKNNRLVTILLVQLPEHLRILFGTKISLFLSPVTVFKLFNLIFLNIFQFLTFCDEIHCTYILATEGITIQSFYKRKIIRKLKITKN